LSIVESFCTMQVRNRGIRRFLCCDEMIFLL
jgi:hypothetical protein